MQLNDIGFECKGCGSTWEPARCDELVQLGNRTAFIPGDYVRCVECKETQYLPLKNTTSESV